MEHTTVRLPPFSALCAENARQLRAEKESTGRIERMRKQFQKQSDDKTALLRQHFQGQLNEQTMLFEQWKKDGRLRDQRFTTLLCQLYRDQEVELAEVNRQLSVAKQKAETCTQLERALRDLNLRPVIDLTTDDTDFKCSICSTFSPGANYFVVECGCVSLRLSGQIKLSVEYYLKPINNSLCSPFVPSAVHAVRTKSLRQHAC